MRYSLRRLFSAVTFATIAVAVGMLLTVQWRRQLAIRDDLLSQGASWVGFGTAESDLIPNVVYTQPIVESIQHHQRFRAVELKGYDVTPQCIDRLSELEHIDSLFFISCELSGRDLENLASVNVSTLLFWNVNISKQSIAAIVNVRELDRISFKNTSVTAQDMTQIRVALPNTEVTLAP